MQATSWGAFGVPGQDAVEEGAESCRVGLLPKPFVSLPVVELEEFHVAGDGATDETDPRAATAAIPGRDLLSGRAFCLVARPTWHIRLFGPVLFGRKNTESELVSLERKG